MDQNAIKHRNWIAESEGYVSIIGNVVLFALKFWVGLTCGSVAIIADAWHTLSDALSSVAVVAGVRLSRRKADAEHPFGHGRFELISAFVIGMMLCVVALDFLTESVHKLLNPSEAKFGALALWAIMGSVVAKELMAQYAFYTARMTKMESLYADGWHHRSDAVSSVVVLIGIIGAEFLPGRYSGYIDGLLGVIVSLIIAYAAWEILKKVTGIMLGRAPEPEQLKKFEQLCEKIGGVGIECHHFHLHDYGSHSEMTFHVRMVGKSTLYQAHHMASELEAAFLKEFDVYSTCHVEPLEDKLSRGKKE